MERYRQWAQQEYLSDTGTSYDIGGVVATSLVKFVNTREPFCGSQDPQDAGNGCIMRLAPVPMFFFRELESVEHHAAESSRTTHGTQECVDGCRLLARIVWRALQGHAKHEVAYADGESFAGAARIAAIAGGAYRTKTDTEIRGSGYVVESLEAAMWCFMTTATLEEALLAAVNLGDDADSTAAVCGQVAGAYYGASKIPAGWLDCLARRSEITALADELLRRARPES